MKKIGKILAVVLTLCMLLPMIPVVSVSAADYEVWSGETDLSWASVLVRDQSDADNTYEYNGTHYQVKGLSATQIVIDTPEKLAGLALLCNQGSTHRVNDAHTYWFLNCTFIITDNFDLSAKNWTPIGKTNNHGFSGMLVGSLGKMDGTGEAVTIKGMKIDVTADNAGLVGTQAGGGIKNINLINASVKSTKNTVGSFVGYIRDKYTVYENLTSDAVIVTTAGGTANGYTGGIAGYANHAGDKFTNCHFTGSVKSDSKVTGGLIGFAAPKLIIEGCSVIGSAEKALKVDTSTDALIGGLIGRSNHANTTVTNCTVDTVIENGGQGRTGGIIGYAPGGGTITGCTVKGKISGNPSDASKGGVGGVIGLQRSTVNISKVTVTAAITGAGTNGAGGIIGLQDKTDSVANISECYVGSTLTGKARIGGFLGSASATNNITNCQFDGTVLASHTQNGAFVGRYNATSGGTAKLTLENCLNTGIAKNTRESMTNAFSWIGHSGMAGSAQSPASGESVYNIKNCYSNTEIAFAGWLDAGASYLTTWTVNEWDGSAYAQKIQAASGTTAAGALASYKSAAVSLENMTAANLVGFDFSGIWMTREGKLPTLRAAEGKTVDTYASADMSWFKLTDSSVKTYTLTTQAQVAGLVKIGNVLTSGKGYTVKVADTLVKPTTEQIDKTWIDSMLYVGDENEEKITVVGLQRHDSDTKFRLIAEIDGRAYEKAGFDIFLSYVDGDGKTHYSVQKSVEVTTCYTSYLGEDGTPQSPSANGKYFVIVEITDRLPEAQTVTVNYSAFVVENGEYVYAGSAPAGVNL